MALKASYLVITGGGVVLLWSGLAGKNWTDVLRNVIGGKPPGTAANAYAILGTPSSAFASEVPGASNPPNPAQVGTYKAFAMSLLTAYGWTGQWSAVTSLIGSEDSQWNPRIKNPTTGALGIAQALGHGNARTAGTLGNEYGGYGLSDSACKSANSGNGYQQIRWEYAYIKETYKTPAQAWAFHQAHGYY
jgi:hypothetical protein